MIDHVRNDGGITKQQAEHLHELFVFEDRVQHASPDINADEVLEAVELLRAQATGLIASSVKWLARHGVSVYNDAGEAQNS